MRSQKLMGLRVVRSSSRSRLLNPNVGPWSGGASPAGSMLVSGMDQPFGLTVNDLAIFVKSWLLRRNWASPERIRRT